MIWKYCRNITARWQLLACECSFEKEVCSDLIRVLGADRRRGEYLKHTWPLAEQIFRRCSLRDGYLPLPCSVHTSLPIFLEWSFSGLVNGKEMANQWHFASPARLIPIIQMKKTHRCVKKRLLFPDWGGFKPFFSDWLKAESFRERYPSRETPEDGLQNDLQMFVWSSHVIAHFFSRSVQNKPQPKGFPSLKRISPKKARLQSSFHRLAFLFFINISCDMKKKNKTETIKMKQPLLKNSKMLPCSKSVWHSALRGNKYTI